MSLQIVRRETAGKLALRVVSRRGGFYMIVEHEDKTTAPGILWLARNFDQAMRRMDLRMDYLNAEVAAAAEDVA